jgi:Domain of unknown function (DUF1707)
MRVTDIDRKATEARLRLAHVEGSITLNELDERLGALWQAMTRRDLAILTMDLPAPLPAPAPVPAQVNKAHTAMKVLTAIWLCASAVNFIIWMMVSLISGDFAYPWFLWPLLPPGAVLAVLWTMLRSSR